MPRAATVAFLLLAAGPAAALPPGHDDAPLRAVQFVDKIEGWAAGDDGVVLHTTDGGRTWERQKTGTRASIRAVQFLTPYIGFAAGRTDTAFGSTGVLLKTADGGLSWAEATAAELPGLNAVRFLDDKIGYAAGDGCNAFPSGVFATTDGGETWKPVPGPRAAGRNAVAFAAADRGIVAGEWGEVATVTGSKLESAAGIPGNRGVRALATVGGKLASAGDGGWLAVGDAPATLPVPAEARAVCDFRCLAVLGESIWAAGRPGSVIFASADAGKTWEAKPTGLPIPVNAIFRLTDADAWAVGDFGTILATADGGKTWAVRRAAGQRAAVMFANAAAKAVPFAALPGTSHADGFLSTTFAVTTADPASADPARGTDRVRLEAATRSAGGTAADAAWGFPLPAHLDGLPPESVFAHWDARLGAKSREHLLRSLVLAIRTWRPDVIVTDDGTESAPAAEQLVAAGVRQAFALAADPRSFPEQISALGLQPHAAKKLYARAADGVVKLAVSTFRADLADAPNDAAAAAYAVVNALPPADVLQFKLVESRLTGAETHANLCDGCDLARGGTARRPAKPATLNPAYVAQRELAAKTRPLIRAAATTPAAAKDFEVELPKLREILRTIPDADAADALARLGAEAARRGAGTFARELYLLAATDYATQPATRAAYEWLIRYHASEEASRRIELADQPTFRPATFFVMPPPDGVAQAGYVPPVVPKVKFRSGEAARGWAGTGLEMEPRLFGMSGLAGRDPAVQLATHAARMRLGLNADADRDLAAYRRAMPGGTGPWFDAVDAELWLGNRGTAAAPAKPIAAAKRGPDRPTLDGKLDDACWAAAAPLPLAGGIPGHATTAKFAYDDEFLYIGVTCSHPARPPAAKADARKRDDDLRGRDRIDVLLDLDRDYQSYYRLRVDDRGCVADDCTGDRTWNPKWFVAVSATRDGWAAEIAVPFAELTGTRPRPGHVWAMNVVRVVPGAGVAAWSAPADADPRPEGMGLLEFVAK